MGFSKSYCNGDILNLDSGIDRSAGPGIQICSNVIFEHVSPLTTSHRQCLKSLLKNYVLWPLLIKQRIQANSWKRPLPLRLPWSSRLQLSRNPFWISSIPQEIGMRLRTSLDMIQDQSVFRLVSKPWLKVLSWIGKMVGKSKWVVSGTFLWHVVNKSHTGRDDDWALRRNLRVVADFVESRCWNGSWARAGP